MSGLINNQSHICGPASAQNQHEQIDLERQILAQLTALNSAESPLLTKIAFSFSDVHERLIYPATGSEFITRAVVIITAAYNDPEAALSIGTADNPFSLFAPGGLDLTAECAYETHPNLQLNPGDSVTLFLSPASASQGRGLIYLYAD